MWHGRLREIAALGGASEMSQISDGDKGLEKAKLHAVIRKFYQPNSIISLDELDTTA
jgi:hypothetical protein